MDPCYSPSSYYHQPACPLHDSYAYQPTSVHSSSSYYYPSYFEQTPSQMSLYDNSPTNIHVRSAPSVQSIVAPSPLNITFVESAPPVGRRRRQRTIFSRDQVEILDRVFEKTPYPDIQLREQLSERLDVAEARIQVWFKNRRSRARIVPKSNS